MLPLLQRKFELNSLLVSYLIIYMKKIPLCWLAESMSINPKQCKNLKFFECRKTKLEQKVEIECKNLKLNWLTGKSRKRNSQMANQIFCFQIKRTPWMAQFFPDCVIRVLFFCSTISKFFHQSTRKFFQRPQIALALRARAILARFTRQFFGTVPVWIWPRCLKFSARA